MAKLSDDTVILNTKPAEFGHRDASITGSGAVWASVKGSYSNEEVLLFRSDLKGGGYTGVLQDVSDKFPSVRKVYQSGNILEAEKMLSSEFQKKGYNPSVENPIPLACLNLDFLFSGFVSNYTRVTDMQSGEVEVNFKHGNATQTRRCFVARSNDVFCYSAIDTSKFDLKISINQDKQQNTVINYEGGHVYFAARSGGGLDYGFVLRILTSGGDARCDASGILIKGVENVTIYVKTFNDSSRDAEFKKIKAELAAVKPYDKMHSAHEGSHKRIFDSYELSLGGQESQDPNVAALLSNATDAKLDSALVARLWNMGKYLSVCGVVAPDVSFFNSAQLLYCGSTSDVLQDMVVNFFEVYEKYAPDLKKNAARIFGAQGYFIPNVISPKSALLGAVDPGTVHFIASSALAANIFYRHYLVSGDAKMLKSRIYPIMREIINFYSDFLKLDAYGVYTTIPSYSPMSTPGNVIAGRPLENFAFVVNSTIDFLAIGNLLDNLIECAAACGAAQDVPMWMDMKTKMPKFAVSNAGGLREYVNSAFIDGAVNCGTMHAYGLWPLKSLSFKDEQVKYQPPVAVGAAAREQIIGLRQASFNAIMSRLDVSGSRQDARSLAVCALQLAHSRLGKASSDAVRETLLKLLVSCFTQSGLCLTTDFRGSGFTKEGAGEVDVCGNIGFTNAITECIVQSNQNTLRVLPCVFDAISSGKLTDVVTDFAARVSIEWDVKKGKCIVKIVPKVSCKINIEVNKAFRKIKSKDLKMQSDINGLKDFPLTANRTATIEFM